VARPNATERRRAPGTHVTDDLLRGEIVWQKAAGAAGSCA
jgi:hypothetical protein